MPKAVRIPSYRIHTATGQARVTLAGKTFYLGRFGSESSRQAYSRLIQEWIGRGTLPMSPSKELSINELILGYWRHCEQHYRLETGQPSSELGLIRLALRPLRHLYGATAAGLFGPLALKTVRQNMIEKKWCRKTVNKHVGRIKQMFRWAVENELVPATLYHGLKAVAGLQKGRTSARETAPIRPVPDEFIEAVLPHVAPQVAAMIHLQLLTGMRPGEVCAMRAIDLETSARVWIYRPVHHKSAWREKNRDILLGPKGQAIVRPWLRTDTQAFLFSPAEARRWQYAQMRQARRSKVQPSQICRKEKDPVRKPGDQYDTASYRRAIWYGCKKADRLAHQQSPTTPKEQVLVPTWHPNQLRHNAATELRRQFGIELARIILGHSTAFTTEIYAEQDRQKAQDVVAKIG